MSGYYDKSLSAERLKRVYDIAPPRTKQYLKAELAHVLKTIRPDHIILELGCGYGRALIRFAEQAAVAVGIDTALQSLKYGDNLYRNASNCQFVCADATLLPFRDRIFDRVICIQNGISAFNRDPVALIRESLRVTKPDGIALFSSYSEKFWKHRLEWFEAQSAAGLLGPIDYEKTHDGNIVCTDGFTATTFTPEKFLSLASQFDVSAKIEEVDESSVFCELEVL